MSDAEGQTPDLVLAMPRRELYGIDGFQSRIEMSVLESLADESWYATSDVIAEDIDAKEVRLGLLVESGSQGDQRLLVDEHGTLVHVTCIPAGICQLADGLAGIKELARVATDALFDDVPGGVIMLGYVNDDSLLELRNCFVLVYRVRMKEGVVTPDGMSWVPRAALDALPLDPISTLVLDGLPAHV